MENGILATEKRADASRHQRDYVVPGDWNEDANGAATF
jgi:hypothetical protein